VVPWPVSLSMSRAPYTPRRTPGFGGRSTNVQLWVPDLPVRDRAGNGERRPVKGAVLV